MLFSVIIPAYNAESFIKRSVASVLQQSFKDFEIIVVNDGSKDNTLSVLKEIEDKRLNIINKKNEGVSIARNTGIQNAKGEYICFLDADDEFLPNHLEILSKSIQKFNDKAFFATNFCMSMRSDCSNVITPNSTNQTIYYENVIDEFLKNSKIICTGCVCIKNEMFLKYGMFEPGVKLGEDTDMWKRIYVHTGVVYIDSVTVKLNRDGSEATKIYTRRFDADPLHRLPIFLNDETILESVKNSLRIEYEYTKLAVVRSYLLIGNKKKAKYEMNKIDKKIIPQKRWIITRACFIIPAWLIRFVMRIKNSGIYE